MSNYAGVHHDVEAPIAADNHGVFFLNSRISYDDISDGPAYTILVGEFRRQGPTLGWAVGTMSSLRNTGAPINSDDPIIGPSAPEMRISLSSLHSALVNKGLDTGSPT